MSTQCPYTLLAQSQYRLLTIGHALLIVTLTTWCKQLVQVKEFYHAKLM